MKKTFLLSLLILAFCGVSAQNDTVFYSVSPKPFIGELVGVTADAATLVAPADYEKYAKGEPVLFTSIPLKTITRVGVGFLTVPKIPAADALAFGGVPVFVRGTKYTVSNNYKPNSSVVKNESPKTKSSMLNQPASYYFDKAANKQTVGIIVGIGGVILGGVLFAAIPDTDFGLYGGPSIAGASLITGLAFTLDGLSQVKKAAYMMDQGNIGSYTQP